MARIEPVLKAPRAPPDPSRTRIARSRLAAASRRCGVWALPNLGVYVPPAYPAAAPKSLAVPVVVYNDGPGDSPATVLQVWANWTGGRPACGAVGDVSVKVPPLKAGADKTLTPQGLSLPAGRATVAAFVDAACAIAETDEDNNYGSTGVTVLPTPQPVLIVKYSEMPPNAAVNGSLSI